MNIVLIDNQTDRVVGVFSSLTQTALASRMFKGQTRWAQIPDDQLYDARLRLRDAYEAQLVAGRIFRREYGLTDWGRNDAQ